MFLAHDVLGDGPRVIFLAHGILGSRNNWRSFAKKLVEARPAWRAVILDLRNHGESHGFAPPHTVEACAADLARLAEQTGAPAVVVGHSFGGKVALTYARAVPPGLEEAWILDAPPGLRSFGARREDSRPGRSTREELERVLEVVSALPVPVASRKALVEELRRRGLPEKIAQWMTTNLRPLPRPPESSDAEPGFGWRFDLDAVPEMLASFGALDLWPFIEAHEGRPRIIIVRGGRSDRWTSDEQARLVRAVARGSVVEHVLPEAGHWLHTDDPEGLFRALLPALAALEGGADG